MGEQARAREEERERQADYMKSSQGQRKKTVEVVELKWLQRGRGKKGRVLEEGSGGHSQCQKLTCVVTLILLVQAKRKTKRGQNFAAGAPRYERLTEGRA